MPLKLVPPRPGKTPNWGIRGTYLRVAVDRSSGTHRKAVAATIKRNLERAIERGEFPEPKPAPGGPTFLSAALAYMRDGRSSRYVGRLIEHFGATMLSAIDQGAIDRAAHALYPGTTPATRNRCVYTPVVAILHHARVVLTIERPKGSKGRIVTDHLNPPDAKPILDAAYEIDRRFGKLLKFLLSTGCRLGEALAIDKHRDVRLGERRVFVRRSKNEDPREILLREDMAVELAQEIADNQDGRLFPFHQGGHLKHLLMRAKLKSLGLPCPTRRPTKWQQPPNRLAFVNFHTFCHTWATWMRRYGGLDVLGLVSTGRWRDARSAARYAHVVARDEWQRVEQLPIGGQAVERVRDAG